MSVINCCVAQTEAGEAHIQHAGLVPYPHLKARVTAVQRHTGVAKGITKPIYITGEVTDT